MIDIPTMYKSIEQFCSKILDLFIGLEQPTQSFINNFWSRLPDWGFILLSTIIAAIVAVRIDRIFRDHKKIHGKKLWKEAIGESLSVTAGLFLGGFGIMLAIFICVAILRFGKGYSSTLTLLIICILIIVWRYRKKKKTQELLGRLKKTASNKIGK